MKNLYYKILRLDKKGYGAYRSLKGQYKSSGVELELFHVQGDPYAQPSKVILRLPQEQTSLSLENWIDPVLNKSTADYLHRKLFQVIENGFALPDREKPSGQPYLKVPEPTEQILNQTCVQLKENLVEIRLYVGLPGQGRKIEGQSCAELLCEKLLSLCGEVVFLSSIEQEELKQHQQTLAWQTWMRNELSNRDWIGFVENGSILPRESGTSEKPLEKAIPFQSPSEWEEEIQTPFGVKKGMVLKPGLNLIVGPAFHGKSTLHDALRMGCYNHIPGDGREGVVTIFESADLFSENGRVIRNQNLKPMLQSLPNGDPQNFSTDNASGSTSQVASLQEALWTKSKLLFLDEDECSVNFLYKDSGMKAFLADHQDTLVPLLDCMEQLKKQGVSLIMVAGASGEYFQAADSVILASDYKYSCATNRAKSLVANDGSTSPLEDFPANQPFSKDWFLKAQSLLSKYPKIRAKDSRRVEWCGISADASKINTLKDFRQRQAALLTIQKWVYKCSGEEGLTQEELMKRMQSISLQNIDDKGSPDFAEFHPWDLWRIIFRTPLPNR